MWNSFNTSWLSSARAKLASIMIALLVNGPFYTALDNKAVHAKANMLKDKSSDAIKWIHDQDGDSMAAQPIYTQRYIITAISTAAERSPLRDGWKHQSDGGLWCHYWRMVLHKSPEAVQHTKVKGHADEDVIRTW